GLRPLPSWGVAVDTGSGPAHIADQDAWDRRCRSPMQRSFLMSTVKVTDESFQADVLGSSQPVLVDFWAEWCGPCKQIAPALEQLSDELAGKVKIAKLDIEQSTTTPSRYGVRCLPTMMLVKDGQMASMKVSAMPKQK